MALVGVWTLLGTTKGLEAKTLDGTTRRLLCLGIGLLLGLSDWLYSSVDPDTRPA